MQVYTFVVHIYNIDFCLLLVLQCCSL